MINLVGVHMLGACVPKFIDYINSLEVISGKDVLNNYDSMKKQINKYPENKYQDITNQILREFEEAKQIPKKWVNTLAKWCSHISDDQQVAMFYQLAKREELGLFLQEWYAANEELGVKIKKAAIINLEPEQITIPPEILEKIKVIRDTDGLTEPSTCTMVPII